MGDGWVLFYLRPISFQSLTLSFESGWTSILFCVEYSIFPWRHFRDFAVLRQIFMYFRKLEKENMWSVHLGFERGTYGFLMLQL